jgi:hypothetical protein
MMAKEKPPITVVGDVGGRIAIIVVSPHITGNSITGNICFQIMSVQQCTSILAVLTAFEIIPKCHRYVARTS